jgi:7-keto-8-aminopelargonate synthetase-like enzyme
MFEDDHQLGFDTGNCETPIIPVHVNEWLTALKMAMRLQEEGVFVNPVVPPAVPPSAERFGPAP